MRIHTWNETTEAWEQLSGDQQVVDDTVSIALDEFGSGIFAAAPVDIITPVPPPVFDGTTKTKDWQIYE